VLKLVHDVLEFLAPKHLLGSRTAVNEVLIQELLASSHSDGGVLGSGSLGHTRRKPCPMQPDKE
jgi:hypothetical protein